MSVYVRAKDKNTILNEMVETADVGSAVHEQQKMAILVRCTEDLERGLESLRVSAEQSATAAESLSKRVFWLNLVLTAATIVAAMATAYQAFHK